MKHFKVGVIDHWSNYNAGEVIAFPSNRPRRVAFEVIANSPIEVWVDVNSSDLSKAKLVASGDDKMLVEYTAKADSWVLIKAEKKAQVWVNLPDLDQSVEKTIDEDFVNLEPRIRENKQFAQMVEIMKLNKQHFDAQMKDERIQLAELRQQIAAMQAEKTEVVEEKEEDVSEADTTT
jgi:ribosomal protein L29